ncbi:MAG TPA: sulfur oxidation c-type cytochrome SoxX [Burkholderiaceae bacterium]|nr:sulfur oxidation c-type cytochrome SoxX [Burkholderiaceae bacterium]
MRPYVLIALAALVGSVGAQVASYQVVGDGIPQSLTGKAGDAGRGRALLIERGAANCLSCHSIKDKAMQPGGTKGPTLDGVGAALTVAQIRLSVVDMSRIARGTPMPSFHKSGGLTGSGPTLSAEQVEDVVAYLVSLKK